MSTNVRLTPEPRTLREAEERRGAFVRSLDEARAEADRDGRVGAEEALAEMDAVITAAETRRGGGSAGADRAPPR